MDSDSYTGSSHWYALTTIKESCWLMLIYHFWSGLFSWWPFPVLRVDVSWQFGFCISDKKPYGILFMGFLLFESTLICIYLLMFSSWECPRLSFSLLDEWLLSRSRVSVMSSPAIGPCEYQISISDSFKAADTEKTLLGARLYYSLLF